MDFSTASASSSPDANVESDGLASRIVQWQIAIPRKFQQLLDRLTPHSTGRWIGSLVLAAIYSWRVYYLKGFYIITYALGIYILNLLIGFLSPQVDPDNEGPGLPIKDTDEFRPFIRRLPEFKFWYALTKGFCFAFVLTFFEVFDVPVFWPILLVYWMVLFFLTMKRQIRHMIKHRYVPFSFGKQRYNRKKAPSEKVLTELVDEKEEETPLMDTKSSSGSELA